MLKTARNLVKYTKCHPHDYLRQPRHSCLIGEHINSLTAQKIASRAYDAVIDYEFGKRGNVQSFLPRAQSLHRHATAKKSAKSFYPKDGITANSGNFKA